jgi:hypothetical protein
VLGARARAGQEHIGDLRRGLLLAHKLVVLLDDAVDGRALLRFGLLADDLEHVLEVVDVLLGLLEMRLEALLQLRVARLLGELRQRLDEHVLRVKQVAEFVQEQLARVIHLGRHRSPPLGRGDRIEAFFAASTRGQTSLRKDVRAHSVAARGRTSKANHDNPRPPEARCREVRLARAV